MAVAEFFQTCIERRCFETAKLFLDAICRVHEIVDGPTVASIPYDYYWAGLISVLYSMGNSLSAKQAVATLNSLGIYPWVDIYNLLVKGYIEGRDVLSALYVLATMSLTDVTPNEDSYGYVIEGCMDVGDLDSALEALQLMVASGVASKSKYFEVLLKEFFDNDTKSCAIAVLSDIIKIGQTPNRGIEDLLVGA